MKKLVSLLLCLLMAVSLIPLSADATESRTSYFKKKYSLTGVYGDDMVAIAAAQNKLVKSDLGYTEEWCADFVSDCARLAKVPAFPYHGGCTEMRRMLLAWGGIWHAYNDDYTPQKGDIVFYSNDSFHSDGCDHVGMIYKSGFNKDGTINTVEGNTRGVDAKGNKSNSCVAIKTREMITDFISDSGQPSKLYVLGYVTINQGPNTDPDNQSPPTRTLKYQGGTMMQGSDVVWVQMVLCKLGYSLDIDGLYGSDCTSAITAFQRSQGLTSDGICGSGTTAKLKAAWLTYKKKEAKLTITAPTDPVTVGEAAMAEISCSGGRVAQILAESSDPSICSVTLDNIQLSKGTAQMTLHPVAPGPVKIRCTVYDKFGNTLNAKTLSLTIGNELQHYPAETVVENIIHATLENDGSYDQVVYCTYCKDELSRTQITVPFVQGDLTGDGEVTDADAIYLSNSVIDPDAYPTYQLIDYDNDGSLSDADAVYLLNSILNPERYPTP